MLHAQISRLLAQRSLPPICPGKERWTTMIVCSYVPISHREIPKKGTEEPCQRGVQVPHLWLVPEQLVESQLLQAGEGSGGTTQPPAVQVCEGLSLVLKCHLGQFKKTYKYIFVFTKASLYMYRCFPSMHVCVICV